MSHALLFWDILFFAIKDVFLRILPGGAGQSWVCPYNYPFCKKDIITNNHSETG